ncbi:hypothetical protein D0S45_16810 [Marinifilum sp. JC120]|nr:hypothetical protein D0S45_16810 [Marinifilum sp. JC120]
MTFKPEINNKKCLRYKAGECVECYEACPSSAIELKGVPELNYSRCVSCGTCAAVCPSGALSHPAVAKLPDFSHLPDNTLGIRIGCHAIPTSKKDGVWQLSGCLSSLSLGALAQFLSLGTQITLLHGNCAQCEKGDGAVVLSKNMKILSSFCPEMKGKIKSSRVKKGAMISKNQVSRRGFIGMLAPRRDIVKKKKITELGVVEAEGTVRERFHKALQLLPCTGMLPENFHISKVSATSSCTGCGACAKICSVNALELVRSDCEFALQFTAWRCIDCGLCEKSCLAKCLSREAGGLELLQETTPRTLFFSSYETCKRCGADVVKLENGYCQICARKIGG